MEWVESTGRSVDDAKEAALDRLGVDEDDAEFDVLTAGRLGLFGRVKEDARVRARVRPTAPRAKDERGRGRGRDRGSRSSGGGGKRGTNRGQGRVSNGPRRDKGSGAGSEAGGRRSGAEQKQPAGRSGGNGERSRDRSRSDGRDSKNRSREKGSTKRASETKEERSVSDNVKEPSLDEQAALAEEFVGGLAEKFGTPLTFTRDEMDDDILRIEATGDDIGVMVGHRGATAQAIDDLVRTVLQRAGGTTREGKIRVDIGGVRARRAAALSEFTRKVASAVLESGNETVLEPMGGADRKLVHDVVSDIDGVDTRSEGEDPYRRVVIVPASGGA